MVGDKKVNKIKESFKIYIKSAGFYFDLVNIIGLIVVSHRFNIGTNYRHTISKLNDFKNVEQAYEDYGRISNYDWIF